MAFEMPCPLKKEPLVVTKGENTLQGGHFEHFQNMYVMYISAKHVAFTFGFHFWCLDLIFGFSQG